MEKQRAINLGNEIISDHPLFVVLHKKTPNGRCTFTVLVAVDNIVQDVTNYWAIANGHQPTEHKPSGLWQVSIAGTSGYDLEFYVNDEWKTRCTEEFVKN